MRINYSFFKINFCFSPPQFKKKKCVQHCLFEFFLLSSNFYYLWAIVTQVTTIFSSFIIPYSCRNKATSMRDSQWKLIFIISINEFSAAEINWLWKKQKHKWFITDLEIRCWFNFIDLEGSMRTLPILAIKFIGYSKIR